MRISYLFTFHRTYAKKLSCAQGEIQKLHYYTLTRAIAHVMHNRQLRYHLRDPVNYHIYH
jgi:hypothetical protein